MASNLGDLHPFNGERVWKLFCSCRGEKNVIFLTHYIDAYEELCKLFSLFGTIFNFVVSDVEAKIAVLREFRNGEHSDKYQTVQSMLLFEVFRNCTDINMKPSGTQTLLQLHRAMEFISAVILKLRDTENEEQLSPHVSEAYRTTLAKHHSWLVRQTVQVALYMLPTRQELLAKLGVDASETVLRSMTSLVSELNAISEVIEKLYVRYHLLD